MEALWPNFKCTGPQDQRFGARPGQVNVLGSWEKHFTLTVPIFTQEYEWIQLNLDYLDLDYLNFLINWTFPLVPISLKIFISHD